MTTHILLNSNIRILVYVVAFLHLVFVATKLLNIDFSRAEDPKLHPYSRLKWKLITTWFNLAMMPYLLICIYCEWQENKGNKKNLASIRHLIFTSIILPTTVFADILFWLLWNKNRELLMPLSTDIYIPIWAHHSMHTVSLLFVLFELISVPRKRPASLTKGISIMISFITLYMLICVESLCKGDFVYPLLRTWSMQKLFVLIIFSYISHLFYYTSQWLIVDIFWRYISKDKTKSNCYAKKTQLNQKLGRPINRGHPLIT
ncbi:androgen-dependent TFPI-regulating protein-like [Colias croceus]|uniref:androgen-dependent TFPI-regulating protein-like n=1 Tax=Colias crocea TaxID=72248 RepID=UPI001E280B6D|nr:androgen-dependent TFPI-regulating protein-like [Colias croceus]